MADATAEDWRPIPGYEATYEVSSLGRIRSKPRRTTRGGIRTLRLNRHGYLDINLSQNGATRTFQVHVLVALAFLGPRPPGAEVRHLNGNGQDPRLANLCYGSSSENKRDIVEHGHHPNAAKTHCNAGHEFTPENTIYPPSRPGCRHCRECKRAHDRKSRKTST